MLRNNAKGNALISIHKICAIYTLTKKKMFENQINQHRYPPESHLLYTFLFFIILCVFILTLAYGSCKQLFNNNL